MSRPMTEGSASLAALLERPLRDVGIDQLQQLFQEGAKSVEDWMLGVEIELFPLRVGRPEAVEYPTVAQILERVGALRRIQSELDVSGAVIGLRGPGYSFSLEPGGQVELATKPYKALARLRQVVAEFTSQLAGVGAELGVRFVALGHHPYANRDTIPKMPKDRYEVMRAYLPLRGSRGLDMMHLTGSVQCAVDFSDERNLTDKVRTAARVSPFLTALTAASPFSDGKPNGFRSARYEIWRDVDAPRCGIWPEMLDGTGLTFARYIERALETPAMLFVRRGRFRVAEPRPFKSYAATGFEGTTVTVADFVDHLTTMFPEIRVKNYIELRGADCVLPDEAVAVAGFWRGILDGPDVRRDVDERLSALGYAEVIELQRQVARLGLDASSAAGPVREIALWLVQLAHRWLEQNTVDCAECMAPLVERAKRGKAPADDLLEIAAERGLEAALERVTLASG